MVHPPPSERRRHSNEAPVTSLVSRSQHEGQPAMGFQLRTTANDEERRMPELEDFLDRRDYAGAITLLRFEESVRISRDKRELWLAYCYFHAGLFYKALRIIDRLLLRGEAAGQSSHPNACAVECARNGERKDERHVRSTSNGGRTDDRGCRGDGKPPERPAVDDHKVEHDNVKGKFFCCRGLHVPKELQDSDTDSSEDEEVLGSAAQPTEPPGKRRQGERAEHEDDANQSELQLYRGICLYALSAFEEAQQAALKARPSKLRRRLLLHIAFQLKDEEAVNQIFEELNANDVADQMSMASIELLRSRAGVAYEIYRRMLAQNPAYEALKVYAALCAFKCGQYHTAKSLLKKETAPANAPCKGPEEECSQVSESSGDVSEDVPGRPPDPDNYGAAFLKKCFLKVRSLLSTTLHRQIVVHPAFMDYRKNSVVASNLLACCMYEEGDGTSACMKVYHQLAREACSDENAFVQSHDLLRHNACVFQKGENALEVFGPLARISPEARLNLVTVFLKYDNYSAAFNIMQDFKPSTVQELMCKANVFLLFGQRRSSLSHLQEAATMFFAVASASGDSTIGLQGMFNYCFLKKDYRGALKYAERLEGLNGDSAFLWNKCLALAFEGEYEEAKEVLLSINDAQCKDDFHYLRWLCRLHVLTGDSSEAIALCIEQIRNPPPTRAASLRCSWDSCALLKETADDCYAVGDFYAALKAFFLLDEEKCDPLLWPALRGAAAGFLHKVLTRNEEISRIPEVIRILCCSPVTKLSRIVSCLKNVATYHNISLE